MKQTMDAAKSWPWLPIELVELIISEAWAAPMSKTERTALFTNLCQISHTWLVIVVKLALTDVHIACPLSSEDYLRLLREQLSFESDDDLMIGASATANSLCRSLTFHIEHDVNPSVPNAEPTVLLYSANNAAANTISSTLYMVTTLHYLPNLRRVSIEYVNWGFEDIPEQGRLLSFPDQVTHLDIKFSFTGDSLAALADNLRNRYSRRWYAGGETPNVRHLSVSGAPIDFVAEMIWSCPQVETVDCDGVAGLDAFLKLPDSLHTLNLHMPATTLCEEDIAKWKLEAALEIGLFSRPQAPMRLVVHSGPPEALPWERVKKLCEGHRVLLVHQAVEPVV